MKEGTEAIFILTFILHHFHYMFLFQVVHFFFPEPISVFRKNIHFQEVEIPQWILCDSSWLWTI